VFSGVTCDAPRWPTKRMALSRGERMVVVHSVAAKTGLRRRAAAEFCVSGCR
jgi:hypothetical protein